MTKRIFSLLLALAMVFSTFAGVSLTASAAITTADYTLFLYEGKVLETNTGGPEVTVRGITASGNAADGWVYTFSGLNLSTTADTGIFFADAKATLMLVGDNFVSAGDVDSVYVRGIEVTDLVVDGTGRLNILARAGESNSEALAGDSLTVKGGHIVATAGNAIDYSSYGVNMNYDLTVSGGKLEGYAGDARSVSEGVYVWENFTVTGGEVYGKAGLSDTDSSYGVHVDNSPGATTLSGGTVTGVGYSAGIFNRGIPVLDGMVVKGGVDEESATEIIGWTGSTPIATWMQIAKAASSAEDEYIVVGVEELCGSNWDSGDSNNQMFQDGTVYTKTYTAVAPGNYLFKIMKNGSEWIGDAAGGNVVFDVTTTCDVTITIDLATEQITVTGDGVQTGESLEIEAVYAVGDGDGAWLNGVLWDPAADENKMTEISPGVYSITYRNVPAKDSYEVKFAANGSWEHNWASGSYSTPAVSGVAADAIYYSGYNIFVEVVETSDVTLTLDLSNYDHTTQTGAQFTVIVNEVTPITGIFTGRYSHKQVFDAQRRPTFPNADSSFTASGFALPYDAVATDESGDRVQFTAAQVEGKVFYFKESGVADAPFALYMADDVDGANERAVSEAGNIYGLAAEGFLYVDENTDIGYFITNEAAYDYGDSVTYTPAVAGPITVDEAKDFDDANTTPETEVPLGQLNVYPYATAMEQYNGYMTLTVDVEGENYQWQRATEKDGTYTDISGSTLPQIYRKVENEVWYRCVIDGKATLPVQAINADESTIPFVEYGGAGDWYLSNDALAYALDTTGDRFDIVGKYTTTGGTTRWINTAYAAAWDMDANVATAPDAVHGGNFDAVGIETFTITFDPNDERVARFTVKLADGYRSFAVGTDTEINGKDNCPLTAKEGLDGTLKQIQMIGASSLEDAALTDAAFVIRPITPASRYWLGRYSDRKAYVYNTTVDDAYYTFSRDGSHVVQVNDTDSGMTLSWMGLENGATVQFEMSIGTVQQTGVILGDPVTTTDTIELVVTPDSYYRLTDENGNPVTDWVQPDADGNIVFGNLSDDTVYVVETVSEADYNGGNPDAGNIDELAEVYTKIDIDKATADAQPPVSDAACTVVTFENLNFDTYTYTLTDGTDSYPVPTTGKVSGLKPNTTYTLSAENKTTHNTSTTATVTTTAHNYAVDNKANDDATLVAACTVTGCEAESYELTIVKPAKEVYGDGKNASATLSATTLAGQTVDAADIVYSGGGVMISNEAPQSAGDYTASITVDGKKASVSYTIDKADATLAWDSNVEFDADYTGNAYILPTAPYAYTGDGNVVVTYYAWNGEQPGYERDGAPTNAGKYYVGVKAEEGTNYKAVEEIFREFEIFKIDPVVSWPENLKVEAGKTLSDISLSENFYWLEPTTVVPYGTGNSYGIQYIPVDRDNYNVVNNTVEVEGLDVTAPTGEITIGEASWDSLLSEAVWSLFFKDSQVVTVTANDAQSGMEKIQIGVLPEVADRDLLEEIDDETWETYTAPIVLDPLFDGFVYVKLTDKAGNVSYLSSDGVVIYNDAFTTDETLTYTKGTMEDKSFNLTLHGNTVKEVILEDAVLTEGEDYTFTGNPDGSSTITLVGEMLDAIDAGSYPLRVTVNPLGYDYVDGNGNAAPLDIVLTLKVQRATAAIVINAMDKTYDGEALAPVLDTDYTYSGDGEVTITYYADNNGAPGETLSEAPKNAGTYYVGIQAAQSDNYNAVSEVVKKVVISPIELKFNENVFLVSADTDLNDLSFVYNGEQIKPEVIITDPLITANDYEVIYEDNVTADEDMVVFIFGKNNAAGNDMWVAGIAPKTLEKADFVVDTADKYFKDAAIEPTVELVNDIFDANDYEVVYSNNAAVGTATITVNGKNNATGSLVYNFEIKRAELRPSDFTIDLTDKVYNGSAFEPEVVCNVDYFTANDYEVVYTNNKNVGVATITITGKGSAMGEVFYNFTIMPKEIGIDWTAPADLVYDGTAKVPTATATGVVDGDTVNLTAVLYEGDNVNAGTFAYKATDLDNPNYTMFHDTYSPTYTITARPLVNADFSVDTADVTYNGSAFDRQWNF